MSTEEAALKAIRDEIDQLDREFLRLINQRAQCAIEVGRIKRKTGATTVLYRAEREAEVLRRARDTNPGPLPTPDVVRLLREVMSACLALEHPITVAYLGPAGTYTQAAALKHFGGAVSLQPAASIDEIIRCVESQTVTFGVVPIENSLEGPVNHTHDCLYASNLQICGEVNLAVHHQFLTHAQHVVAVTRVYAHAQALAQCRRWLDANCPNAERVATTSNAEAARRAAEEPTTAAIAAAVNSELYALPIRTQNIEDQSDNTTRFLIVGQIQVPVSGGDLTSLVFSTKNRAGALCEVLQALAASNISMTRIQSRPLRAGTWEYVFFVDIVGHRDEPQVAAALRQIGERTSMCRVLGSYPRAVL